MATVPGRSSTHDDRSDLPKVLSVQATRKRYPEPKMRARGLEYISFSEAVEFLVRTSGPVPVSALSPALFVGDTPIIEGEPAGPNLFRYFAFEFRDLVVGAPISFGWPQLPQSKVPTGFRYQPAGAPGV